MPIEGDSLGDYQSVAIILARIVPSRLRTESGMGELHEAIQTAFEAEQGGIVRYCCLGRQDILALVRAEPIEHVGRIWRPRGIRKVDIQYGYMRRDDADQLFGPPQFPLMLAVYAKLSDEVMAQYGRPFDLWDTLKSLAQPGRGEAAKPREHVIRTLGWNDVLIVQQHESLRELLEVAPHVWDFEASKVVARWPGPLFSRTYSLVGFRLSSDECGSQPTAELSHVRDDKILAPRIEMRIRPGRTEAVKSTALRHLSFGAVQPVFTQELGHEDGTVAFERKGVSLPKVSARRFLQCYYDSFLPAVDAFVHATQLCLAAIPDPDAHLFTEQEVLGARVGAEQETESHLSFGYVDIARAPTKTIKKAMADPITASAVDSLHALYEACDWSIENEALRTAFGDLQWHVRWLLGEGWRGPEGGSGHLPGLGRWAEELGAEVRTLGNAFAQRLAGAYYGIMGYQPEHLFSHSLSLHKTAVGLWALHNGVLGGIRRGLRPKAIDEYHPYGCWVVSHGQRPAVGDEEHQHACRHVAQLPARGVVDLHQIAVDIAHEIGHMAFNSFASLQGFDSFPSGGSPTAYHFGRGLTFYSNALGCALDGPNAVNEVWPRASRLLERLACEIIADRFAMRLFLHGDLALVTRRLLEYLQYHEHEEAGTLLLRAYVQFCVTLDDDCPGSGQGLLFGRAASDYKPKDGEEVTTWVKRSVRATHRLSDPGTWQAFKCACQAIGPYGQVGLLVGDEACPFVLERFPGAGFVVAFCAHWASQVADRLAVAHAAGIAAGPSPTVQAFGHLFDAQRGANTPLDSRVRCVEELWLAAISMLTNGGYAASTQAGTSPAEGGSPWKALASAQAQS